MLLPTILNCPRGASVVAGCPGVVARVTSIAAEKKVNQRAIVGRSVPRAVEVVNIIVKILQ